MAHSVDPDQTMYSELDTIMWLWLSAIPGFISMMCHGPFCYITVFTLNRTPQLLTIYVLVLKFEKVQFEYYPMLCLEIAG